MVVIALANNISKGEFVLRAWLELRDKVHFAKEKKNILCKKKHLEKSNTYKNTTKIQR